MEQKKILKFICGAGNENLEEIEKLSFIYASSGFNMIDTSPKLSTLRAVHSGIKKAGKTDSVSVCVSIGLKEDVHFSKARIIKQNCSTCSKCLYVCPQKAVYNLNNKISIDEKKCIGCLKCIKICSDNAIIAATKNISPTEMLIPILNQNIDCVEFHCSSDNETKILDFWNKIKSIYKGQLSICLNRSKLGDEKIIKILKIMVKNTPDVIIQADGNPMSGNTNDYKSNIQAIAFADLIRRNGINSLLILSGGTNAKTEEFAEMCGIDIDGIALGSYARKLVNKFVSCEDFWENHEIQNAAISIVKSKFKL